MGFVDTIFPFWVGHRTEVIAVVNFTLRLAALFGAPIPPPLLDAIGGLSVPLAGLTLSAKLGRQRRL